MSNFNGVEIAIVGMSGRFPGAPDIEAYWNNIRNGVESVSFFTEEELMAEGASEDHIHNPAFVPANAYLSDKEYFDADFFGYLPAEAKLMDPQLRLFHEQCWHVLEDAGYGTLNKDNNKIGLFAGATSNNNWENYSILANMENTVEEYTASQLRDVTFLCARISYLLDLQGPSVFINTACSTSLVAVQRACMSLLTRECNMAIAGGICITNYSKRGYLYQDGMINSPDGHCRPFDKDSAGTVSGEGVGVVLLKRLADAIKDGDTIHAVVRGSAVNNDGHQKMSFTSPGVEGQYKAIVKAMQMAKVPAESISYVEAHGTATSLGDPIEVEALNRAFGNDKDKYCALGSVKSNIGHLDAAAGVAGLIKTVLALKHRQLPPSLHYTSANAKIDFDNGPFYVNTELKEWSHAGYPLRAGVSSFGIGGTNAHVILEEAPAPAAVSVGREQQLLLLSGKNAAALERNTRKLLSFLKKEDGPALADVAYTLQIGRTALEQRRAVVCSDRAEAVSFLEAILETPTAATKSRPQVVFMFSGQGSQYINMCRGLYEREKVFRQEADRCFEWVKQRTGRDLRSVIFTEEDGGIDHTVVTQPALFIVEYALCRLLLSRGIKPDKMIGHSIGEYVAACIGGLFTLEDALDLVVTRGRLMQQAPSGSMAAVSMSEESLLTVLATHPGLSIAAVNSSELCVVSGDKSSVTRFEEEMTAEGHRVRVLRTSHAFHCYLMDGILEEFGQAVRQVKMGELTIPLVSNLTGAVVTTEQVRDPKYWVDHLRQAVLFSKGIEGLLKTSQNMVFVEVGPGRTLSTLVRAHKEKGEGHAVISLVRPVQDETADEAVLLKGLGELWVNGIAADWATLYEGQKRRRVSLPGYAFERVSYPVLVDAFKMIGELVSENVKEGDWYYVPSWRRRVLPEVISPRPGGRTLILCDEMGVGRALGAKLESQGEEVICAEKEEVYDRLAEVSRIIHVWGVQGENLSRERACELYFYSLTRLVRAAQQQGGLAGKEIVVVTSDLHPIVGGEAGSPYKALSQGMLKVLSQENPSLITSHIDLTLKEEVNIDALAAELFVQEKGKLVGYRNNRRWIQGYDRLATTKSHRGIRTGGLYVVTGGLGKLGYELSRYLLDSYQARVVLLGRATLPLDMERATRIEELERMGEVMYLECDISDADALRQAVEKTETRWGSINGVIHAAAVTTGRSINGLTPVQELTTADYALQFGPKIEGLEALKEVLGDRELDFCLLTSSLSAILGGLGFGAYASANVYMDAYIQGHRDRGQLTNWVSVNLDGLNFKDSVRDIHSLNNREIREVLEEVLSMKEQPQVIVSKGDLHRRLKEWVSREEKDEDIVESDPVSGDEGVGTVIERKLLRIWRDFFGKDSIGPDSDFFEIGGDSLKALTMIGRIHKALNTRLSVTEFFKRSSIRKLGEYISTKEPGNILVNISIPIAERKEFYPLSPAQQRLYFLYTFDKSSIAYNMPQIIKLEGELDRQRLQGAFYKLIRRHESLRTSFDLLDGVPVQKILEDIPFDITYTDMMEEGCLPEEEEIDVLLELFVRPFDLDQAPLIRVGLIKIAANEHILMVDMHHIISDGVSFGVLINDFMSLYNDMTLPDLSVQYRDYAEWEQSETRQTEISRQKQFWLRQFASLPALLQLPEDHKRPAVKSPAGDVIRFYLGAEETAALKRIAKKEGVTMFMLTLSIYNILIARLGNQDDVVVGTPTAGRPHGDLEKIIGMFVNTLPLRNFPKGNMSVRDFLDTVKDNTLACFDNQSYPYESLINELKLERDTSRNPLFDTMFAYHNFSNEALQIPGLTLSSYGKGQSIAKFDLMLNVMEAGEQLFLSFEYATALYNRETINRFIGYFNNIVGSVIRNINTPISRIDVLSREEQLRLLLQGEGEKLSYPKQKTLVEIFEEQARRTPANTALLFNERTVTYRELEIGADTLAGYLEQKGVGAGSVVGIMIDRSPEMILAIIGILKTGATYLPLDGSHPEERTRYILQNSKATFLLTEKGYLRQYSDVVNTIDIHDQVMYNTVRGAKTNKTAAEETAYIIYTSGTTGVPKGVMVNHRSVINLICSQGEKFRISEKDRVLQFSTICFDASVEQIWLALLSGAALVLIDNETIADQAAFKTYIDRMQVSHLHATPSFLEILDPGPYKNLKRVIAGGEECKTTLVEKFGPGYAFYNEYGPTETTVTSIEYLVPENRAAGTDSLPIGRPIDNTRIYILGKNMELLPPGVIGELYIGGDGVAMGYVGNAVPGKFLSDPFREGERVYRSGDLAKWLPDGNLSFFGRTDDQVKLRGFRIQLSEIELRLAAHADVTMSVVLLKEQAGGKYLVGYYTGSEDLKPATLKAFLAQTLPGYMVPSYFVRLENMPLTPTGKIDKKALPDPVLEYKEAYTAPTNEVEAQLVRIWSAVLGVDQISIYSNYFDLGGHSLSIIKMNKMINDHFKCNISIASIFRLPNIHALADYIINGDTKIKELEAGLDEREDALGLISELIN